LPFLWCRLASVPYMTMSIWRLIFLISFDCNQMFFFWFSINRLPSKPRL
jgi:hypothetical protein